MKKKILILALCFALAIPMAGTLTACNQKDKEEAEASGRVKLYLGAMELDEDEKKVKEYFESQTDMTLEYEKVAWDTVDVKYIMDIAAGKAPDLVYMNDQKFPVYALKKIVRPLEDFLPEDAPEWQNSGMDIYMYAGKHYGFPAVGPLLLWYNKSLFDEYQVKDPDAYVREGNWTWETFSQTAKAMTIDKNGDNVTDIWGYATWRFDSFFLTNNANVVRYTPSGGIDLLLDTPEVLRSFTFMQDAAFKDKWCNPIGNNTWADDFKAGNLAMTCEGAFIAWQAGMKTTDYDIRVTEMPRGPDNQNKVYPSRCDAIGLCVGGKNPEGALKYLRLKDEFHKKESGNSQAKKMFSEYELNLIDDLSTNRKLVASMYSGIGELIGKQLDLFNDLMSNGVPPATAVAAQKPVWQNQIDITLANVGRPEIEPFTAPGKLDFENGPPDFANNTDASGTPQNTEWSVTEASGEAISGKSLLIKNSGGVSVLLRTDPAKLKIPGYHTYKVTFDYKMLGNIESFLSVSIRSQKNILSGKSFGNVVIRDKAAGETGKVEAEIMLTEQGDDFCLVIMGRDVGDMVIDNLEIVAIQ